MNGGCGACRDLGLRHTYDRGCRFRTSAGHIMAMARQPLRYMGWITGLQEAIRVAEARLITTGLRHRVMTARRDDGTTVPGVFTLQIASLPRRYEGPRL